MNKKTEDLKKAYMKNISIQQRSTKKDAQANMLNVIKDVCAEIEDEILWGNMVIHPDTKDPYKLACLLVKDGVKPEKEVVLYAIEQMQYII